MARNFGRRAVLRGAIGLAAAGAVPLGPAPGASGQPPVTKTRATFYTPARRAAARANIRDHAWARTIRDGVLARADRLVGLSDEWLWSLVTGNGLPRSYTVNEALGSPTSGREMYTPFYDTWALIVPTVDGPSPTWQEAHSTSIPQTGAWTHLAGVHDAAEREIRLYVNGRLEAVRGDIVTWPAAGRFRIGRSSTGGRFAGTISDVQAWSRAIAGWEVAHLAS